MNGLQQIPTAQDTTQRNELQEQQARLDQMYGYNTEEMDEEKREWWQKFLQFLRESKERDMQRYRQQII